VKKRVYFNEFNLPMDKTVYLPLVSGILQAYAQTFPALNDDFEFMPFLFIRDTPEKILAQYDNPSVAAFSVCIWNHQLSLAVAKLVKEKFPACQIVFGGPQVLADDKERYSFIDHIILEEGEKKFVKWLGGLIGAEIKCDHHTLDDFPSPYTAGLFDRTLRDHPGITFQAIVESNRGCPFACNFCVAEDSIVTTSRGECKISEVTPDASVLGWDECLGRATWNRTERSVCTGVRHVIRISAEGAHVDATSEHKILTAMGWKLASEVCAGDYVLHGKKDLVGWHWLKVLSVDERPREQKVYDLINARPSHNFFANGILVHNCYWGQGFEEKKVRHHSLKYVRDEADWIARNGIKYAFLSDANFGMFDRDRDVARIYVEMKQKYNFPEKLRVCYGKNQEEKVYKTAKILSSAGLAKAITLARQSNDLQVLANIERANIKLSVYENLQERYHADGIPTYTEIILGLPGETTQTFHKGINEIMGSATQLFIYHCSILPNTEMANPEYIAKHGIKTVRVPLAEIHCAIRKPEHVVEYEDIIIQTNTMSIAEWIGCCVFSWEMQLKQSFNTNVTPEEHDKFRKIAIAITLGASRGQVDLRFGNIYWEPEEMAFLRISLKEGAITGDLKEFARDVVLFGRKSNAHQPPLGV